MKSIGICSAVLLNTVLLAGCAFDGGLQRTSQLLGDRLQDRLGPDITAGRVALDRLPDGARVTLLGDYTPPGPRKPPAPQPDVRAGVVEALLDPSLMRIAIADTSTASPAQRQARVRDTDAYFRASRLGPSLVGTPSAEPAPPAQGATPGGLAITINVQCPPRHGGIGYGTGKSDPTCR